MAQAEARVLPHPSYIKPTKLIQCVDCDGDLTWLNPTHIVSIVATKQRAEVVVVNGDEYWFPLEAFQAASRDLL